VVAAVALTQDIVVQCSSGIVCKHVIMIITELNLVSTQSVCTHIPCHSHITHHKQPDVHQVQKAVVQCVLRRVVVQGRKRWELLFFFCIAQQFHDDNNDDDEHVEYIRTKIIMWGIKEWATEERWVHKKQILVLQMLRRCLPPLL